MANPFENPGSAYLVVANDEGQYSLWPASIDVPAGWTVIYQSEKRDECIKYIDEHWTDMRPKSLIKAMEQNSDT
jgi:MbtH protein